MLETRRSKRKPTGGLRNSLRRRDKRLHNLANPPINTTIGEKKQKKYRGKGGNVKIKAVAVKEANLAIKGKNVKAEIINVEENNANKEFARRNILTKGAKIKVKYDNKEYDAVITNRPGQEGFVSAKII